MNTIEERAHVRKHFISDLRLKEKDAILFPRVLRLPLSSCQKDAIRNFYSKSINTFRSMMKNIKQWGTLFSQLSEHILKKVSAVAISHNKKTKDNITHYACEWFRNYVLLRDEIYSVKYGAIINLNLLEERQEFLHVRITEMKDGQRREMSSDFKLKDYDEHCISCSVYGIDYIFKRYSTLVPDLAKFDLLDLDEHKTTIEDLINILGECSHTMTTTLASKKYVFNLNDPLVKYNRVIDNDTFFVLKCEKQRDFIYNAYDFIYGHPKEYIEVRNLDKTCQARFPFDCEKAVISAVPRRRKAIICDSGSEDEETGHQEEVDLSVSIDKFPDEVSFMKHLSALEKSMDATSGSTPCSILKVTDRGEVDSCKHTAVAAPVAVVSSEKCVEQLHSSVKSPLRDATAQHQGRLVGHVAMSPHNTSTYDTADKRTMESTDTSIMGVDSRHTNKFAAKLMDSCKHTAVAAPVAVVSSEKCVEQLHSSVKSPLRDATAQHQGRLVGHVAMSPHNTSTCDDANISTISSNSCTGNVTRVLYASDDTHTSSTLSSGNSSSSDDSGRVLSLEEFQATSTSESDFKCSPIPSDCAIPLTLEELIVLDSSDSGGLSLKDFTDSTVAFLIMEVTGKTIYWQKVHSFYRGLIDRKESTTFHWLDFFEKIKKRFSESLGLHLTYKDSDQMEKRSAEEWELRRDHSRIAYNINRRLNRAIHNIAKEVVQIWEKLNTATAAGAVENCGAQAIETAALISGKTKLPHGPIYEMIHKDAVNKLYLETAIANSNPDELNLLKFVVDSRTTNSSNFQTQEEATALYSSNRQGGDEHPPISTGLESVGSKRSRSESVSTSSTEHKDTHNTPPSDSKCRTSPEYFAARDLLVELASPDSDVNTEGRESYQFAWCTDVFVAAVVTRAAGGGINILDASCTVVSALEAFLNEARWSLWKSLVSDAWALCKEAVCLPMNTGKEVDDVFVRETLSFSCIEGTLIKKILLPLLDELFGSWLYNKEFSYCKKRRFHFLKYSSTDDSYELLQVNKACLFSVFMIICE